MPSIESISKPSAMTANSQNGATNVCKFASDVGANYLLFTSTMMVYGPTEAPKDEDSLLEPVNAYGRRKSSPRASTAYGNRSVLTRGG